MVVMQIEMVANHRAFHGEGPVWDPHASKLRWVDMLAGDVLTTDPSTGGTQRLHVGEVAAAVRPRREGGLVVAIERGFALVEPAEESVDPLDEVWSDKLIRMNDGGCDPQGRFYCGSMALDESPGGGALHRLNPDRSVSTVLTDVTVSNGLAWSPDGSIVYYVDTACQRIDQFDFDAAAGTLHERRPLVNVPLEVGRPDGLTVDADGGIWLALWGGGALHRYTSEGILDAKISIPVTNVTACSFGGEDLKDLYVTTSQLQAPPGEKATAGALYRVQPGVGGAPILEFAG